MLYRQIFKTWEGAVNRATFERAHVKQRRDNVNFRFFAVRCNIDGTPDTLPYDAKRKYVYRVMRTLSDWERL